MTAIPRRFTTAPTVPAWAVCDRTTDITDLWIEATDPEAERGEIATAHLAHDATDGTFALKGISIKDTCGTLYRDRDWTVKFLGIDAVWRIEASEMQAAPDRLGNAYDAARERRAEDDLTGGAG